MELGHRIELWRYRIRHFVTASVFSVPALPGAGAGEPSFILDTVIGSDRGVLGGLVAPAVITLDIFIYGPLLFLTNHNTLATLISDHG